MGEWYPAVFRIVAEIQISRQLPRGRFQGVVIKHHSQAGQAPQTLSTDPGGKKNTAQIHWNSAYGTHAVETKPDPSLAAGISQHFDIVEDAG